MVGLTPGAYAYTHQCSWYESEYLRTRMKQLDGSGLQQYQPVNDELQSFFKQTLHACSSFSPFTFPLSFPSLLCLSSLLCFIQDTAQLQVVGRSSRSIATFETSSVPLQYSGSLNSLGEPHSPSSSDEEREDLFNE